MKHLFGTIRLEKRKWRIAAEPHVIIRAKRVFAGISKDEDGLLLVGDTVANCRDLLWFLDRFPLDVEPGRLERLKTRSAEQCEREDLVGALLEGVIPPQPFELAKPARDYQRLTAQIALAGHGCLDGSELGVGKTVTGICFLTDPRTRPALVVAPTHLQRQWVEKIEEFAPHLTTHILKQGTPYDYINRRQRKGLRLPVPGAHPDVLVTSYGKLQGWVEVLSPIIKGLILEECHELRSGPLRGAGENQKGSAKGSAAQQIANAVMFRLGLSATPILNYGGEIYWVLQALKPWALGTAEEFRKEWCTGAGDKATLTDPSGFGSFLRAQGLMVRHTRKDVAREIPALTKVVQHVESDPEALEALKSSATELARIILNQAGRELSRGEQMRAGGELDARLRQATGLAKCLKPGTEVVRLDGTLAKVEDVKRGDLLLGPDSKPRRVLDVVAGEGEMYEVSSHGRIPLFAPYVVNADHVLALKHSGVIRNGDDNLFGPYVRGDHIEIPVSKYVTKSAHFRRMLKGYQTGVDFPERSLPLDPYFMGLWIGDGTSLASAVTTADPEIRDYLYAFARSHGLSIRLKAPKRTAPTYCLTPGHRGGNMRCASHRNPVLTSLRRIGVLGNKHIPHDYLINSRANRLKLLAGLIDSDGTLNASGGGYTISSRWAHLADEIRRLAISLGFAAKVRALTATNQTGKSFPAHRVCIYGDGVEGVPLLIPRKRSPARRQIKDASRSGITVRPVGVGPFNGFTLDGDGLFLLRDYTVTHNSPYVVEFVKLLLESEEKILLAGWHRDVYSVWLDGLKDFKPVMYTGSESPTQKEASKKAFCEGDSRVMIISLRSGSGLDGLQYSGCKTVVHGELDWSYGIHHQLTGRIHRDGQPEPVLSIYLISDSGSDPIVADVLGVKREQLEGLIDPFGQSTVEHIDTGAHIKRLAEELLRKRAA